MRQSCVRRFFLAKQEDARVAVQPVAADEEAPLSLRPVRKRNLDAFLLLHDVDELVAVHDLDAPRLRAAREPREQVRSAHALDAVPAALSIP